jgi:ERCC4-related helicase/ERCC4-type nuclease
MVDPLKQMSCTQPSVVSSTAVTQSSATHISSDQSVTTRSSLIHSPGAHCSVADSSCAELRTESNQGSQNRLISFTAKPRIYQQVIGAKSIEENTLVVLPTGLGKTLIASMVAYHFLQKEPTKKVIFFAPTRPLVNQHKKSFMDSLSISEHDVAVFTGHMSSSTRSSVFSDVRIIFSTPQGFENDILASRIDFTQISVIIFDEAHRATGDYSYVWIAKQFRKQQPTGRILALTASPGTTVDEIKEVCDTLSISRIEYRQLDSPDVSQYVQQTKTSYIPVQLPQEQLDIIALLDKAYAQFVTELKSIGFFSSKSAQSITKTDLLSFTAQLFGKSKESGFTQEIAQGLSIGAKLLKLSHAIDLAQSQSIVGLKLYFDSLHDQAKKRSSKAVVELVSHPLIKVASAKTLELSLTGFIHPKIDALLALVETTLKKTPQAKLIIFSQFRETLTSIVTQLNTIPVVHAKLFVGQAKKNGTGLSQKEQLAVIDSFKNGEFNVICMSSVGEEGLDIPSVDTVVFYEPIPSAIRSIQRRGRTGRHADGQVYVLVAQQTKDVAMKFISQRKEKNMYVALEQYIAQLAYEKTTPKVSLSEFIQPVIDQTATETVIAGVEQIPSTTTLAPISNPAISNPVISNPVISNLVLSNPVSVSSSSVSASSTDVTVSSTTHLLRSDVATQLPSHRTQTPVASVELSSAESQHANSTKIEQTQHIKRPVKSTHTMTLTKATSVVATDETQKPVSSTTADSKPVIIVDSREKSTGAIKVLYDKDVDLRIEQLMIGDIILSKDVVVEFKTVPDFVDSLLDGRLLTQLRHLKDSVLKPLLIIEGEQSIYGVRQVHPHAISGLLTSILLTYKIPVICTKNHDETATLLYTIARKEQGFTTSGPVQLHEKKPQSLTEQQLYSISALPGIGFTTAQKLLERFTTIATISGATQDELISCIGLQKGQQLYAFFHQPFKKQ